MRQTQEIRSMDHPQYKSNGINTPWAELPNSCWVCCLSCCWNCSRCCNRCRSRVDNAFDTETHYRAPTWHHLLISLAFLGSQSICQSVHVSLAKVSSWHFYHVHDLNSVLRVATVRLLLLWDYEQFISEVRALLARPTLLPFHTSLARIPRRGQEQTSPWTPPAACIV